MTPALQRFRDQFAHTGRGAYLDHAAAGVLARPVLDAVQAHLKRRGETDPGGYEAILETADRARARLAALVGTTVDRVEFAPNTSAALNVVAQGLDWRPGDRIVVPEGEFPANRLPWLALEARGVVVDPVPVDRGTFSAQAVAGRLTPRTRLVAVSWVQFLSGFRADLAAIAEACHRAGVGLVVDAIQGVGALKLEMDALGLDFVACGGHKWLGALQGGGFFAVSERLQDQLTPVHGWLNGPVDWDDFDATGLDLHPDATRFRQGMLNGVGVAALDATAGLLLETGREAVEASVLERARQLAEGADRLGMERFGSDRVQSGIVTVVPPDPETAHARLAAAGVTASLRNRMLRFAPHAYTTPAEVDLALRTLADA